MGLGKNDDVGRTKDKHNALKLIFPANSKTVHVPRGDLEVAEGRERLTFLRGRGGVESGGS